MKPSRSGMRKHTRTPLLAHLLVTTVGAFLPALAWADDGPPSAGKTLHFTGKRAAEVLAAYEQRGLDFIYSSDVLDTQRRFATEPPPGNDIARLRHALQGLGATLRVADHNRRWLIVPLRRTVAEQQEVAANDAAEATRVPLRTAALEEVIVATSRYALHSESAGAIGFSTTQLDALQLQAQPELGDDALRAVNHLPGTASLGLSAQTHVRGGNVDETLILFNGMELIAPYHLRSYSSVFSGLHPSTVDSIYVYTGGFPARYGGRMGAVIDIHTQRDSPDAQPGTTGELQLSPFTTAASVTGHHDLQADAGDVQPSVHWQLAARRGNVADVADKLNRSIGSPQYYDWFGEAGWRGETAQIAVGALAYDDDFRLREFDNEGLGTIAESVDQNRYAWVRVAHAAESWSTQGQLHIADVGIERHGSISGSDADESTGSVDDQQRFRRVAWQQSADWQPSAELAIDAGYTVALETARYRYRSSVERGEFATLLGVPDEVQRDIDVHLQRQVAAAYGEARWQMGERWHAQLGARVEGEQHNGDGPNAVALSPRVSLRYDLAADTQLRLAVGRFRQPHALHELQTTDGETRLQQAQIADHLIIGFDHVFPGSWLRLRAEAFNKRIAHPKRRFENLLDPLVQLPELSTDRIEVASKRARSHGIELQLNAQPTPQFGAWISYSHAATEDQIAQRWMPRTWDQSHTVQSGALWTPGQWTIAASVSWHSGWRSTRLPQSFAEIEPLAYRRNNDKLPNFFSVDVRASRLWASAHQSFLLFAEVTNLTNHQNIGAQTYGFQDEDLETTPIELGRDRERVLPFVPSIGFVWKFF